MNAFFSSLVVIIFFLTLLFYSEKIMGFAENFSEEQQVTFTEKEFATSKYRLGKPKGYPVDTATRKYPLVVYLHDAGARGSDNIKPAGGLAFLGNGSSAQAEDFQNNFPCFVYVPQCPFHDSWEGKTLDNAIQTIEHLKSTYPIDPARLYLIGYSMGGSGTYELASKYYDHTGQLFAAIIRMAGQSSFAPRIHEIIAQSAVWIHIGLQDTPLRLEKAREAYAMLKKIYGNPSEDSQIITFNGQQRKTSTLIIDNQERVKLTEYPGAGHGISHVPFEDPAVLEWLFEQKIK